MALDWAIHRDWLLKILKQIYADPMVGPVLGFKGGTAAYLVYGLDRFSVDLDFDLLDEGQEDKVFEQMKVILSKFGVVKTADKKRFNLVYVLVYENKKVGAQNIKVEINRRDFGSNYVLKSYLGIAMKVMVEEDMMAHKLVAMVERAGRTNRDLYDVWWFLDHDWEINEEMVEKRMGVPAKKCLDKCIGVARKVNEREILMGLGELLDNRQKQWVKEKLLDELVFQLRLRREGWQ